MANLKEFFNKISNNNRIYTREDIGNMSSDEFRTNEKAIDYQLQIWEFLQNQIWRCQMMLFMYIHTHVMMVLK